MEFCGYRIGNTSFYQSMELSDRLTTESARPVVYVKREDENEPTFTFKVRGIVPALMSAKDGDILAAHTLGNLGAAGVEFCHVYGKNVKFASIIPKDLDKATKKRLSKYGNFVIEMDSNGRRLSSGEIIDVVKRAVNKSTAIVPLGCIDADGTGYKAIAQELYDAGVRKDWTLYVPVGGGDLLANLVWKFEELGEMPHIVAATIDENIFSGKMKRRGKTPADKLVAHYSHLEKAVTDLITKYEIPVITVSPEEIEEEFAYSKDRAGLKTSRTSAVAFAAPKRDAQAGKFKNGQKIAIINTGYEPEEEISRLGTYWQYAKTAAGILLLASMPFTVTRDSKNFEEVRFEPEVYEKWRNDYAEEEKERLSRVPELADITTYALFVGKTEKLKNGEIVPVIDRQVYNDLTYWYFSNDMIARMMYNDGKSMRRSVDGFTEWTQKREEAKKAGKGYWDFSKE